MRPSVGLVGLLLVVAPTILAQDDLPNLSTLSQPDGQGESATSAAAASSGQAQQTSAAESAAQTSETEASESTDAAATSTANPTTNTAQATTTQADGVVHLSGLPTLAGVGIPDQKVPDTAGAPFMQKSDLPDGTVFICVGAILAFFGAAVLAWRGLVAWSLHRSVKRAAMAQNMADIKSMSAVPGSKKRGMYNVVGANSTMSLDHLTAAPATSRGSKPFAQAPGGTPPRSQTSLFFSPTAGGATGLRDSVANRSSTYLPAGYYASGNAAPGSGSPMTQVGGQGQNLSVNSFAQPGNRFSARSGISPPESPSLPPSRGTYSRAPPSRDGLSTYNRNSVATLGTPGNTRSGIYAQGNDNVSQLSLNVPGGTSVAGGRAPSAYLEDLFENHGSGPRERF
ncbi:Nn.00g099620.m01.CDS01 [Neocucurbitaria sp. VM-36]